MPPFTFVYEQTLRIRVRINDPELDFEASMDAATDRADEIMSELKGYIEGMGFDEASFTGDLEQVEWEDGSVK
jgi:hypothetical protein